MAPTPETLSRRILRRVRRLMPQRGFAVVQKRLLGGSGIEIGGPSAVFQRWNLWPLYPVVATLDQYNFAQRTIWSAPIAGNSILSRLKGSTPSGSHLIGDAS